MTNNMLTRNVSFHLALCFLQIVVIFTFIYLRRPIEGVVAPLQASHTVQNHSHPLTTSPGSPDPHTTRPKWLLATMSRYENYQRRSVIRSSWQRLFKPSGFFETRFVIARPKPEYQHLIDFENSTYGDIIVLEDLGPTDDPREAKNRNAIETWKYLLRNGMNYNLVSKVEDDVFVNANEAYRRFIEPHLHSSMTIIGHSFKWPDPSTGAEWLCAGGQFYTLSWDLMTTAVQLHDEIAFKSTKGEDTILGELLYKGGYVYGPNGNLSFVDINAEEDLNIDVTSEYHASTLYRGDVGPISDLPISPISLHMLKEEEKYLNVAAYFDESGWLGTPKEIMAEGSDESQDHET